jgi:hypothetical protein
MSTRHLLKSVGRLVLGAVVAVTSASCGGELLRTGRAPVYLVVTNIAGINGAKNNAEEASLHSDVLTIVDMTIDGKQVRVPTIFDDGGKATIRAEAKNQSACACELTAISAVTLTRYRVNFRRSDGRNTPGVDVPYGFDGGLGVTVSPGQEADVAFMLVRHQNKAEPPLRNMVGAGGQIFVSTIAEVTFYGRDQNGNEVMVTANMDVQFGDFGDEQ